MMIAHSFRGELFGPAQKLHGATYVVDVELRGSELTSDGVVVDIGRASGAVSRIVGDLTYRNLDEIEQFRGHNTTTEFLARYVYEEVCRAIGAGELGPGSVSAVKVTLWESHVAWAAFEGAVPPKS